MRWDAAVKLGRLDASFHLDVLDRIHTAKAVDQVEINTVQGLTEAIGEVPAEGIILF